MRDHPIKRELQDEATERVADLLHMDLSGASKWIVERGLAACVHDYGLSTDLSNSYEFWRGCLTRTIADIKAKGKRLDTPRARVRGSIDKAIADTAKSMVSMHWRS